MTIPLLVTRIKKVLGITWGKENDTFVFDFKNLVTLAEELKPTNEIHYELVRCFMNKLVLYLQLYYNLD